jgi:hypothetical protein
MSEAKLDQIVKGAPAPENDVESLPTSGITSLPTSTPLHPSDPLASLPSSPPQIYLNLLILEASLRAQYLELRARRQQYTFFLTLLGAWITYFSYALFLAPREDGVGVGGSIYWVIEVTEKVAFMGGIVTGILVWGTGQWERGIRWPRRWVGITNRGLRVFNCKIVVAKGPWWKEWASLVSFLFSYGLFMNTNGSSYRHIDHGVASELEKGHSTKSNNVNLPNIHEDDTAGPLEEDLAPGGDTIKLLLLPKPFSPAFRENWDLYRTEYWERENERRRILRKKIAVQDKALAKQKRKEWWLARFRFRPVKINPRDVEKVHHPHHAHTHSLSHSNSTKGGSSRTRSSSLRAGSSSTTHSRNSSRASTPTLELDDHSTVPARRGSTASTSSVDSRRPRKKKSSALQKLTPTPSTTGRSPSPGISSAPEQSSPLVRQNSVSSSDGTSRPTTPAGPDTDSLRSLRSGGTGSPEGSPRRQLTKG